MWQLLPLAAKFGADYLAGRNSRKAQDQTDRQNNARNLLEYDASMAESAANIEAQNQYNAALGEAGKAGLAGRNDAFSLLQDADDEEEQARDNLAKAIAGFGKTSKEARLAAAKAKRSGRVAKAVKGAKVKGTSGAGRSGIRGALRTAKATGLKRAANTSAMAAGLGAYGDDLSREMGMYNDLAGKNAALGNFSKWGRETAREREQLASQDEATMRSVAGINKSNQNYANSFLGPKYLPFDPLNRIRPNNTGLNAFGALMGGAAGLNSSPWAQQDEGNVPFPQPNGGWGDSPGHGNARF